MDKDSFIRKINEKGPSASASGKMESKPPESRERESIFEDGNPLIPPLFIELAHRIKNTLSSVKNITQLSRGKFKDLEFEDYFHRSISEDIEKIESVIDGLLNYVKISTPVIKSNTVHSLLEDISEKSRDQLEEKKIRLFKKFEKDLPETVVHEEQLRYVLQSILQYAIASSPPNGSIGILTKLFDHPKTVGDKKGVSQKDGKYLEVLIGFTGYKKPFVALEPGFRDSALQRDEAMDLVLRLVKEIVRKNQGIIQFDIDEKKPRTFISLIFPVERRRVVYYPKSGS
jgi:nitrogen-specific signal transduction histidine kinase